MNAHSFFKIVCFFSIFILTASTTTTEANIDQIYPAPKLKNTTEYGKMIPRTMNLIQHSTPEKRNTVRIMVWGQSWEKQEWSKIVSEWLKTTYPNVNFVFCNPSMGGFASEHLLPASSREVLNFYPDLLIFHVGMMSEWSLDSICALSRRNTATELMLYNGFYPTGNAAEASFIKNKMAPKYHAELVDAYQQFFDYTKDYAINGSALSDGHLTKQGNYLLAELVKAHFVYHPGIAEDPDHLVWTYRVGTDVVFENGKLTLPFAGNKVELVGYGIGSVASGDAKILIDGKAPSEFPGCYSISRPNGEKSQDWINGPVLPDKSDSLDWPWNPGALTRVQWNKPLVLEKWTATLTNVNMAVNPTTFNFSIAGSVTGPDGSGTRNQKFTSNSGRVVIEPSDWFVASNSVNPYNLTIKNGFQVTWDVLPMYCDTFKSFPAGEYVITAAQGLSNTDHTLELEGSFTVPLKEIRVYRPLVGRAPSSVKAPGPYTDVNPIRYQKVYSNSFLRSTYDLNGRKSESGKRKVKSMRVKIKTEKGTSTGGVSATVLE